MLDIKKGEGKKKVEGKGSKAISQMLTVKQAVLASTVKWLDITLTTAPTSNVRWPGQLPLIKKKPSLIMLWQTTLCGSDQNLPPSSRKKPVA